MAQCVCAEVMSATIHHQVFGKTGLRPGPGKLLIDPSQVSSFRPIRRKHPSSGLAGTARHEQIKNAITHGDAPSCFGSFALRIENHAVERINVLNAHPAYFGNIPHAGVARNHEDVF